MFIDGAYLRAVISDFAKYWYGLSDVPFLYNLFADRHNKVFYYDCLPVKGSSESEEDFIAKLESQQKLFRKLRALHGWHVLEGVVKRGRKDKVTQKEVDVMIAVDMLTHTHRRNMSELTFVAGDQDFLPLVEALVREGMFVNLLYERESGSTDLINAADARRPMDVYLLHSFLSSEFQDSHPLPRRYSTQRTNLEGTQLICSSTQKDGTTVNIVAVAGSPLKYIAMIDTPDQTHISCYEFKDIDFLKKTCDDCIGTSIWINA
jgi:uncharacterized LabA/DUF88 family protein